MTRIPAIVELLPDHWERLVAAGWDGERASDQLNRLGESLLSWAACHAHSELPSLLAAWQAQGGSLEITNYDGRTPLMWAAFEGHSTSAKVLLEAGADPNAIKPNGSSVLHCAVSGSSSKKERLDILECLFEHGADYDRAAQEGRRNGLSSPLCHAFLYGDGGEGEFFSAIRLLLGNGASVEERDLNGNTLLHLAAIGAPHVPLMVYLLEAGLSKDALNTQGSTPRQMCQERNLADFDRAVALFEERQAMKALPAGASARPRM